MIPKRAGICPVYEKKKRGQDIAAGAFQNRGFNRERGDTAA
jgi:hypothetical protein